MPRVQFGSFWRGDLSPYERACLTSFVKRGYGFTLYSYEPIGGVPEGIEIKSAEEIVPKSYTQRFIHQGKPSLGIFSDYFRYQLFRQTQCIWVDTDVMLIKPFTYDRPTLLAKERPDLICGALLRVDSHDPHLDSLIKRTEAQMDAEIKWGATGPWLVTDVFGKSSLTDGTAANEETFFPIPHMEFWKVFLPEYTAECENTCANAITLHLWNNLVEEAGIWKKFAPPAGSYLHNLMVADGSDRYFTDTYPEKVMKNLVSNWLMRKSGDDLGVKTVIRQVIPSLIRAGKHRLG